MRFTSITLVDRITPRMKARSSLTSTNSLGGVKTSISNAFNSWYNVWCFAVKLVKLETQEWNLAVGGSSVKSVKMSGKRHQNVRMSECQNAIKYQKYSSYQARSLTNISLLAFESTAFPPTASPQCRLHLPCRPLPPECFSQCSTEPEEQVRYKSEIQGVSTHQKWKCLVSVKAG